MRDENLVARVASAVEAPLGTAVETPPFPIAEADALTAAQRFGTEAVAAEFERLVAELDLQIERIAAPALEAMRESLPRWVSESESTWSQLDGCIRNALRGALLAFRAGSMPARLPAIDATVLEFAERIGDLPSLLTGYRYAQTALWGVWFDLVGRSVADEEVKRQLCSLGSGFFFRYAETVGRLIAEARQESDGRYADVLDTQLRAVNGLPPADMVRADEAALGVDRHHLGLVVWGKGGEFAARQIATLTGRGVRLRRRLRDCWWSWRRGPGPLSQQQLRLLEEFEPEPGIGIAFGLEGHGEQGRRDTIRQALRAQELAPRGAATTHYSSLAVEALALGCEADARAFVAHELRGIDDDSVTAQRLRETLAAYFAADLNAAAAGARLGIHHQTVSNRLRAAEERLGRSLASRGLELALALRLRAKVSV